MAWFDGLWQWGTYEPQPLTKFRRAHPPSTLRRFFATKISTETPGIDGLRSNPVGLLEYPIGSLSAA